MKSLRIYLPLAFIAFLFATTGADVLAQLDVAGEAPGAALQESLYYSGVQLIGTALLFAPFATTAFICAYAEKFARRRSIFAVFGVAMAGLLYFYFAGHFAAQQALLEEHWTAAALSIGLLPFLIGPPVAFLAVCAAALAAKLDPRVSD